MRRRLRGSTDWTGSDKSSRGISNRSSTSSVSSTGSILIAIATAQSVDYSSSQFRSMSKFAEIFSEQLNIDNKVWKYIAYKTRSHRARRRARRSRCECFLSLILVWLDDSTRSTRSVWTGLMSMYSVAERGNPNEVKHSKLANQFANSSNSQILFFMKRGPDCWQSALT